MVMNIANFMEPKYWGKLPFDLEDYLGAILEDPQNLGFGVYLGFFCVEDIDSF